MAKNKQEFEEVHLRTHTIPQPSAGLQTLWEGQGGVDFGEELTTFENFKAFPRVISFQNAILCKVQVADGWGRLLEL